MAKHNIAFLMMNIETKGGTGRVVSLLSNMLFKNGHNVFVISCKNNPNPNFYINEHIPVYSLHGERTKNSVLRKIKNFSKLKRYISDNHIDVVIAVDVAMYFYVFFLQNKIKTVVWEQEVCDHTLDTLMTISRNLAVRFADSIVTLTEKDMKRYQEKYKTIKHICYIYNPVDKRINQTTNLDNKKIIAVGRLEEEKSFIDLIRAWNYLEHDFPDWTVEIYGDGSEKECLQNEINNRHLKNIKLMGFTNNIYEKYLTASIFALTSLFEGFCLVLVESMRSGLACISFECNNGPNEIIQNDVNGILVKDRNVWEYSQRLRELMTSKEKRLKLSASAIESTENYSEEKVYEKWENLISFVTGENKGKI